MYLHVGGVQFVESLLKIHPTLLGRRRLRKFFGVKIEVE
jgi:hypothetical protein